MNAGRLGDTGSLGTDMSEQNDQLDAILSIRDNCLCLFAAAFVSLWSTAMILLKLFVIIHIFTN